MQLGHRGGGGADYAGTIGLTHDATVAGCIDRGAANGLTRGSAMFCGEATSLLYVPSTGEGYFPCCYFNCWRPARGTRFWGCAVSKSTGVNQISPLDRHHRYPLQSALKFSC